jgi:epoxyqueuosine reductase
MGNWIYGCDICQDVCPWNQKHAKPSKEPAFQARDGFTAPKLSDVIGMDQAAFSQTFKGSPIKRAKRRGLVRNAVVALGNVGSHLDVPVLVRALCDVEPLVRGHAAWALGQIGGGGAYGALEQAWIDEEDQEVREEIHLAMEELKIRTIDDRR